jgi:RNA polymerase sigma-70 factor (ECF subfamily)
MKHLSDNELYQMLSREHAVREAAFAEIYQRHSGRIFSYCRKIIGSTAHADDIFQETFLTFLNTAGSERMMTNLPAYLLRIARHLCLEQKRHGSQSVPLEDFDIPVRESNSLEANELSKMISAALELVSDEQREAFVLQMEHDMSYQDIAETMEVPVTTVRNWIVRAKSKIRNILSPYLEES